MSCLKTIIYPPTTSLSQSPSFLSENWPTDVMHNTAPPSLFLTAITTYTDLLTKLHSRLYNIISFDQTELLLSNRDFYQFLSFNKKAIDT